MAWALPVAMAAAGAMQAGGSAWANQQNIKFGREQMAFQERMANTAYQRQVEDMRKAGLNPALAYGKMGGANTPPGAAPRVSNPFENVVSSALDVRRAQAEVNNLKQQNKLLKAQTDQISGTWPAIRGEIKRKLTEYVNDSSERARRSREYVEKRHPGVDMKKMIPGWDQIGR